MTGQLGLFTAAYAPSILRRLAEAGVVAHHIGLTDAGHPKHPQARGRHRVPDDVVPQRLEVVHA